jgi:uncharacterized membrane protein
LSPGDNAFRFSGLLQEPGIHSYQAYLEADQDGFAENNVSEALVQVRGEPAILYVYGEDPSFSLVAALEAQGFRVAVTRSAEMRADPTGLARWDLVIFDNVPAYDLSLARMEALESYVRSGGGGFLMLGGDVGFGMGGYYKTPIERVLPVDVDVTSSMQTPSLSLVMVVDKSGSMGGASRTAETKLEIVKEAALSAVEVLNPFYTVGLLAFDADTEWIVPVVPAGERSRIVERLSRLSPGGGTRLYPALEEGRRTLAESPAAVRHVLVLSDGLTDQAEFEPLVREMAEAGITVSTVAVGEDANRELMRRIAEWGGGRSYHTVRLEDTPRIFATESLTVSRELMVEETFLPTVENESEILSGISEEELPPLDGFVLTYTKSGATQILTTFKGNPLLATWKYGLGRSAAFTSDLGGRWSEAWLDWERFPAFVGQLARWTERPPTPQGFEATVDISEGRGRLAVEARDDGGGFLNGLRMRASVVGPDRSEEVELEQTAPGRYETSFRAASVGAYLVTVAGEDAALAASVAAAVPYSAEYARVTPDRAALERLADITGGQVLDDSQGLFLPSPGIRGEGRPVVGVLLALALLLFAGDIAARLASAQLLSALFRRGEKRAPDTDLSLDEVRRRIEESRRAEAQRARDFSFWFGRGKTGEEEGPERLHVPRGRRR